jgi:hypothetical protein
MSIARFRCHPDDVCPDDVGDYVRHSDYARLATQVAALEKERGELASKNAGLTRSCEHLQRSYDSYVAACDKAESALAAMRAENERMAAWIGEAAMVVLRREWLASDVLLAAEVGGVGDGGQS